ncbi:MAG: hypothetical protein AAF628_20620 [Planctomycetota bacterium]
MLSVLASTKFEADVAQDLATALQLAGHAGKCLLLLDASLSGGTPQQVGQRLLQIDYAARPYVVLLATPGELNGLVQALGAAVQDGLAAPPDVQQLAARLGVAERTLTLGEAASSSQDVTGETGQRRTDAVKSVVRRMPKIQRRLPPKGAAAAAPAPPASGSARAGAPVGDQAAPSAAAPDAAAAAASAVDRGSELEQQLAQLPAVIGETLEMIGVSGATVEATARAAGAETRCEIVALSAIARTDPPAWVQVRVEVNMDSLNQVYEAMVGEAPSTAAEVMDAGGEVLNLVQGAVKTILEEHGVNPLASLLPNVNQAEAAPVDCMKPSVVNRYAVSAEGVQIYVTVSEYPVAPSDLPPSELAPTAVVYEPVKHGDSTLVKPGVILSEQHIERLTGLEADEVKLRVKVLPPPHR